MLEGKYLPRGDIKNAAIRPGVVCQAGVFEMRETLLKSDEFSALLIDARGLWPIAR
jgi:hypothetical protein